MQTAKGTCMLKIYILAFCIEEQVAICFGDSHTVNDCEGHKDNRIFKLQSSPDFGSSELIIFAIYSFIDEKIYTRYLAVAYVCLPGTSSNYFKNQIIHD